MVAGFRVEGFRGFGGFGNLRGVRGLGGFGGRRSGFRGLGFKVEDFRTLRTLHSALLSYNQGFGAPLF